MHACLADLLLCMRAIELACSNKSSGAFESVGLGECVADARALEKNEILKVVTSPF